MEFPLLSAFILLYSVDDWFKINLNAEFKNKVIVLRKMDLWWIGLMSFALGWVEIIELKDLIQPLYINKEYSIGF